MTIPLRQSTASQEIPLGFFVDSTDGNDPETSLTIANTDIKLWKHGATTLASKNSGGATHISDGIYYAVLDATDTNTLGGLIAFVHVTGALAVKVECEVMPANVYDSLVAGTDTLQADLTQIGGTTQSATDLGDFVDTGYDPATHKVQGVVLTDTTTTNTDMTGTDNAALAATALSDVMWTDAKAGALTDWINGGRLDLILDIIAADTTTDIPALIATAQADLNTITGADGVTLATAQALYAPNTVVPDAAGVVPTAVEIRTEMDTNSADLNAILIDTNMLQTDWVNGGRLDLLLDACALEATVGALNDLSAANVNSEVADVLKTDTTVEMSAGAPPAAPTIEQMINYIYRLFRNKTLTTSSLLTVRNDADSADLFKATISDDSTTFTKEEYVTG